MGVLKGQVVAITSAGRGIGREIPLLSARDGAAVVVNLGASHAGEESDRFPVARTNDVFPWDPI